MDINSNVTNNTNSINTLGIIMNSKELFRDFRFKLRPIYISNLLNNNTNNDLLLLDKFDKSVESWVPADKLTELTTFKLNLNSFINENITHLYNQFTLNADEFKKNYIDIFAYDNGDIYKLGNALFTGYTIYLINKTSVTQEDFNNYFTFYKKLIINWEIKKSMFDENYNNFEIINSSDILYLEKVFNHNNSTNYFETCNILKNTEITDYEKIIKQKNNIKEDKMIASNIQEFVMNEIKSNIKYKQLYKEILNLRSDNANKFREYFETFCSTKLVVKYNVDRLISQYKNKDVNFYKLKELQTKLNEEYVFILLSLLTTYSWCIKTERYSYTKEKIVYTFSHYVKDCIYLSYKYVNEFSDEMKELNKIISNINENLYRNEFNTLIPDNIFNMISLNCYDETDAI
jgi:hypothetical protein